MSFAQFVWLGFHVQLEFLRRRVIKLETENIKLKQIIIWSKTQKLKQVIWKINKQNQTINDALWSPDYLSMTWHWQDRTRQLRAFSSASTVDW